MRSFIVFPIMVALAVAEEQFLSSQMNSQSHFPRREDTQPVDEAVLEERLLEEMKNNHPATHLEDEMPHPRVVHQDPLHPKRTSVEAFPQNFEEEVLAVPHDPVPIPHLVEEEPSPQHVGAGGEDPHHRHGSVEVIHHNAVEVPFEMEQENPMGTESTLNGDLFDHHPNTGVPEVEPTVGTEAGPGMEVVQEPVVLPVTEGKNRNQDQGVQYGGLPIPKELLPIHPGGGSKFEDLEKEKLEKKKMSRTKGTEDDTENGASHEAEGLYSSAATLCLSSIIFSLSSSFRLIV